MSPRIFQNRKDRGRPNGASAFFRIPVIKVVSEVGVPVLRAECSAPIDRSWVSNDDGPFKPALTSPCRCLVSSSCRCLVSSWAAAKASQKTSASSGFSTFKGLGFSHLQVQVSRNSIKREGRGPQRSSNQTVGKVPLVPLPRMSTPPYRSASAAELDAVTGPKD